MGIGPFKRHSKEVVYINESVPDPKNWSLESCVERNGFTVLKLRYPECKNQGGMKILVYQVPFVELVKQKELDPHFGDKPNYIWPIARFAPTDAGWDMAMKFIDINRS